MARKSTTTTARRSAATTRGDCSASTEPRRAATRAVPAGAGPRARHNDKTDQETSPCNPLTFSTCSAGSTRSGFPASSSRSPRCASPSSRSTASTPPCSFNYDWVAPLGNNFQGNNLLAAHPGNLDGLVETTSAQEANLIKYRSAVWNGLSFGLLYGLGGVAGDFSNGRIAGGAASYTNGPLASAAAYVDEHDRALGPMLGDTTAGLGLSSFQGKPALSYVADKIENTGVGARYDFGRLRLHAVFTYVRIVSGSFADSYRTWETGATWLSTPANAIVGGIAATGFIGRHYLTATLGDVYSLSKSTQVYLQAVAQQATGTTDARASIFSVGASGTPRQLAFVTGIHHLF
ncbi:porin [Burkholderia gladioli]|uniref:porin n=2 Tax=Burkholderia gladioli TaxID=28095 RepID=UPI003F78F8D6